ncbi:hypothetical protein E2C01_078775 [Portunus trituberculatus]|uniref:Uncharacterized protein n=1 Tax=Portunus trituberculatus TaxID=210409 RepID=A0A5B7IHR0_PORTR|nr:hypothetical protein [Portunus trituberculatus]
MCRKKRKIHY